jgi:hypothetical protein
MKSCFLLAAGLFLLAVDSAAAFHDSQLDHQTKQTLINLEGQVAALGNSLAAAQQRCQAGDSQACQWEQELRRQLGSLQQAFGGAGAPGPPQGGFMGQGPTTGGFQAGPAPLPPEGGAGGGAPIWDQPRQPGWGQGQ